MAQISPLIKILNDCNPFHIINICSRNMFHWASWYRGYYTRYLFWKTPMETDVWKPILPPVFHSIPCFLQAPDTSKCVSTASFHVFPHVLDTLSHDLTMYNHTVDKTQLNEPVNQTNMIHVPLFVCKWSHLQKGPIPKSGSYFADFCLT